ncbi:MAG TPA: hypothetical protein VGV89_03265 [Thermoplasmata archaeon]|nr:hypothetical protein [Thermoplasmata archaeon]
MLFNPGESIYHTAQVYSESDGSVATLYLTDQRLAVELAGRGGLLGARPAEVQVNAAWVHVRNAPAIRKMIGRPFLQIETTNSRSMWKTEEAERLVDHIAQMKSRFGYLPPPPPPPTGPAAVPLPHGVVVNVAPSAPSQTIERQVVKVRCRYCGKLGDEVLGHCPSCGAAL